MNIWLFVTIQAVGAAVLSFVGIVVVLSFDMITAKAILSCVVAGLVLSIPVAWYLVKYLTKDG